MWVYIEQVETGRWERWEVYADPAFDVDQYDLNLFIDRKEFCNPSKIYGDLQAMEMSCASYEHRGSTPDMYATVDIGFRQEAVLVCAKHRDSRHNRLIYACRFRD